MSKPSLVILQNVPTKETRTARLACLTQDIAAVNCNIDALTAYQRELEHGALPIGSVEFVRFAMQIAGIPEPANISYPEGAQRFLGRRIHRTSAGQVLGTWFVKPLVTKAFTGFVFDTMSDESGYSEADRESLQVFMQMPADAPVWISEPVEFVSEWRYYVQDGQIIGSGRYDTSGAENAPIPDLDTVMQGIMATCIETPFAADFGVLSDGRTVLVEANDFWSIGLYGQALRPDQYLAALYARWASLLAK